MAAGNPQIPWSVLAIIFSGVALLTGSQWIVSQTQFADIANRERDTLTQIEKEQTAFRNGLLAQHEDLKLRMTTAETVERDIISKLAHDPVEQRTFEATVQSTAKEIDQVQAEITDINRQIAAALIIIDNNASPVKRAPAALPP